MLKEDINKKIKWFSGIPGFHKTYVKSSMLLLVAVGFFFNIAGFIFSAFYPASAAGIEWSCSCETCEKQKLDRTKKKKELKKMLNSFRVRLGGMKKKGNSHFFHLDCCRSDR
ncbi:MAG: hypothetical protein GY757_50665 [bacterium]|nr:hypothetical protein [bacterium]